jgi:hypothetical protein
VDLTALSFAGAVTGLSGLALILDHQRAMRRRIAEEQRPIVTYARLEPALLATRPGGRSTGQPSLLSTCPGLVVG